MSADITALIISGQDSKVKRALIARFDHIDALPPNARTEAEKSELKRLRCTLHRPAARGGYRGWKKTFPVEVKL